MRVDPRWLWLALAVVALAVAAQMTRYAPVEWRQEEDGFVLVLWDRWTHRMCFQAQIRRGSDSTAVRVRRHVCLKDFERRRPAGST